MGVCCKERANDDELLLHGGARRLPKLIEENEHKFKQMLTRVQIANPFMKVVRQ
jgi:hypothetical protein